AAERPPDGLDGGDGADLGGGLRGRLHAHQPRSCRSWTMLYATSGSTATKRMTASAEPRPGLNWTNDWEDLSLASTLLPKLPPVIVRTMSNTFSVVIMTVVSTTISVFLIIGTVT